MRVCSVRTTHGEVDNAKHARLASLKPTFEFQRKQTEHAVLADSGYVNGCILGIELAVPKCASGRLRWGRAYLIVQGRKLSAVSNTKGNGIWLVRGHGSWG